MEELSDGAIIAASLRDAQVFERLFDRYFERVFRFLSKQVGVGEAEDLAAETFARAFDSRRRFDRRRESAAPWLFGIARNVLREHWRRAGHNVSLSAAPPFVAAEPNDDRAVAISEALRELREPERQVLLLLAWGDLTYEEIAETVGVPVGTVRSRLNRARGHLRARLRPGFERKDVVCDG